jgi:hypothetical protein
MADLQEIREAVVIRPGDTLVVRCDPGLTLQEADTIRAEVLARLAGIEVVIMAVDQLLVCRPGEVASCA